MKYDYLLKKKIYEIEEKFNEINKEYNRKRTISIVYIIKHVLLSIGFQKANSIRLKNHKKSLELYDKWWNILENENL